MDAQKPPDSPEQPVESTPSPQPEVSSKDITAISRPADLLSRAAAKQDQPESSRDAGLPEQKIVPADEGDKRRQSTLSAAVLPESDQPLAQSPPWTLQQFFNGEIDLDVELVKRFPMMPVMSRIKFRTLGTQTGRGVATLSSQDNAASIIIDADANSRVIQLSFTFGSMITLRFALDDLSDMDRSRWLELMQREQGGLAFLWGPGRWQKDYIICIARKYFTNMYAFSPRNFEAAIRMTPEVTRQLMEWLEKFWKQEPPDKEPPRLLTW